MIFIMPAPAKDYEYARSMHQLEHREYFCDHAFAEMEHEALIDHFVKDHDIQRDRLQYQVAVDLLTGEVTPVIDARR